MLSTRTKKNPTSCYSVRGGGQVLLDDLHPICEDKPNKHTQDRVEKWENINRKWGKRIVDVAPTLVEKKEDLAREEKDLKSGGLMRTQTISKKMRLSPEDESKVF